MQPILRGTLAYVMLLQAATLGYLHHGHCCTECHFQSGTCSEAEEHSSHSGHHHLPCGCQIAAQPSWAFSPRDESACCFSPQTCSLLTVPVALPSQPDAIESGAEQQAFAATQPIRLHLLHRILLI